MIAVSLAAVSCAVATSGCGSSGKPKSAASASSSQVKFSDCMRSHGIANFPDPSAGGGIQINSSSGINPQSPAFQSAQSACSKLLPGGGPGRGPAPESRRIALVKLARCMREHGLATFPDPTSSRPSAPPSGGGIAFGGPGGFISVPETLIQSPAFKQAASDCGFPGAG